MKLPTSATFSTFKMIQADTLRTREAMQKAQQESITGQQADAGLFLGSQSGRVADLKGQITKLESLNAGNAITASKLDAAQFGLAQLNDLSQDMMNVVGLQLDDGFNRQVWVRAAQDTVMQATEALNLQVNGVHVFAGINTDQRPIGEYENGAGQAAFDTAFNAYFGFPKTDPAVSTITDVQMSSFLATVVEPQFDGPDWQANFSSASDEAAVVRIGDAVETQASVSANEEPIRDLMAAAVTAFELGSLDLRADARRSMTDFVLSKLGSANAGISDLQSGVGVAQAKTDKQVAENENRIGIMNGLQTDLLAVDQYEAATRLTNLVTQLEASYAITARLQNLSLVRYL